MPRLLVLAFEAIIQETFFWIGFILAGIYGGLIWLIVCSVSTYLGQYLAERRGFRAAMAQVRLIENFDAHGELATRFLYRMPVVPPHFVDEQDTRHSLRILLAVLAARARIPVPALLLVDDRATGFHLAATMPFRPRPLVLVARELVTVPESAIGAVLAHELAHCVKSHGRTRIAMTLAAIVAGPLLYGLLLAAWPPAILIPKALGPMTGLFAVRLFGLARWEPEADRQVRRLGADPAALAGLLIVEANKQRFDRLSRWLVKRRLAAFARYDGLSLDAVQLQVAILTPLI